MCGTFIIALYTVQLKAVDGEILLLRVPVAMMKVLGNCCPHYDILLCGE